MPRWNFKSDADRFWSKVDKRAAHECWLWKASKQHKGYGQFRMIINGIDEMWKAQRIAWYLTHNQWPGALYVLHKCDVRACVNPAHLLLGTNDDNVADRVAKDRTAYGEASKANTITVKDAITIRWRRFAGETCTALANEYGISASQVGRIGRIVTWRHAG